MMESCYISVVRIRAGSDQDSEIDDANQADSEEKETFWLIV